MPDDITGLRDEFIALLEDANRTYTTSAERDRANYNAWRVELETHDAAIGTWCHCASDGECRDRVQWLRRAIEAYEFIYPPEVGALDAARQLNAATQPMPTARVVTRSRLRRLVDWWCGRAR